MVYEHSEHFIMPLSHDEMVHMKGSLYEKMPGDHWQRLANLRTLLAYQITRPGKSLLFMGTELAAPTEWNHDESLPWHLLDDPTRAAFRDYVARMGSLYQQLPPLWRGDVETHGFEWIDVSDKASSVLSYVRWADEEHVVVVLNLTPAPREQYRLGVPEAGEYRIALSTDDQRWGGSGYAAQSSVHADDVPYHGRRNSVQLTLPPLSVMILVPAHVATRHHVS
jgi:1,4-alpha-glucan branching enzyme